MCGFLKPPKPPKPPPPPPPSPAPLKADVEGLADGAGVRESSRRVKEAGQRKNRRKLQIPLTGGTTSTSGLSL